jgi:hypothetical protein
MGYDLSRSVTVGEAKKMHLVSLPVHLCHLCCVNTIGTKILALLIREAQRIKFANYPYWRCEFALPRLKALGAMQCQKYFFAAQYTAEGVSVLHCL